MWLGDSQYKLAGSLLTLISQLVAAYPDQEWQTSGGTGTIGDAAHISEGSASDHNPWLNNTVRALDVAKTANGPDCEALFRMVNTMYGARDPRVFPYGYAIFNGRITDWDNPGGFHAQVGDQHLEHCHISVGQSGYNATNPWPIPGATSVDPLEQIMAYYASKADFEAAIQRIVNSPTWNTGSGPHSPDTVIRSAVGDHVDGAVRLLVDMAPRVAAIQAMVGAVAKTVGAIPASVAAVSKAVAAIAAPTATADAQAITDAVVAKVKALAWKAS